MGCFSRLAVPTVLLAGAIGAPFSPAQVSPAQNTSKGVVVGIVGEWKLLDSKSGAPLKDSKPLKFGDHIDGNSCVAGNGDSLVVTMPGIEPVAFTCDKQDAGCPKLVQYRCVRRIAASGKPSTASLLWAAIVAAFDKPDRYRAAVSRGLEPRLLDSVLRREGDLVDFSPALQEMNAGSYRFRLEPVNGGPPTGVIQVRWSKAEDEFAAVPGIHTGLYRLVRLTPEGKIAEPAAWILVVGPDRFHQDVAALHSAQEEMAKWPADVDPQARGAVLRAYLESLAEKAQQHP
jgi:hypothetical protein